MREASAARFYEMMVITNPDGTPEELTATVDQITGYITTAGGSILRASSDSPWGRRRLAYPIRYQSTDVRDGFYTLIHMEVAPEKVIEIERDLKLNDRLMRYLVLQLSGEPVFPEPVEEEAEAGEGGDPESGEPSEASAAERREPVTAAADVPAAEAATDAAVAEAATDAAAAEADAPIAESEADAEEAVEPAEDAGVTEEEPDVAE